MAFNKDLQEQGSDEARKIERGYIVWMGLGLLALIVFVAAAGLITSGGL